MFAFRILDQFGGVVALVCWKFICLWMEQLASSLQLTPKNYSSSLPRQIK